jgi:hypothetical protein
VLDRADRRLQHDGVAERLGHPDRDQLSPAGDAVLLGAALGVEQQLERPRRADIEENMQQ